MGGFFEFARGMAELFKGVGAAALQKMEQQLAHRLAAELASPAVERRMAVVDKVRAALRKPELPLDAADRKKIEAELVRVSIAPRPAAALLALTEAAQRAGWTAIQRFIFLQQVVPDGPIEIGHLEVGTPTPGGATGPVAVAAPPAEGAAGESDKIGAASDTPTPRVTNSEPVADETTPPRDG